MLPIDTIIQTAEIEARVNRRGERSHPYRPAPVTRPARTPRRVGGLSLSELGNKR
jgi:hypothetical protein